MISDLHTHTTYSDGFNTPEEMVISAIDKGLDEIGISDHSYTYFDESYCMRKEMIAKYKAEINNLKLKYADKISVKCGIEQDYYSNESTVGFDYIIGSVHYLKIDDNTFIPVDENTEMLKMFAEKYFNNDIYLLCEKYFETVSRVVEKTNCDIIGHFDLISKFSEKCDIIDTNNQRYISAWKKSADILINKNIPFEINVGGILGGYKTAPYPSESIQQYLKTNGAKFLYSSDAHNINGIAFRNI